MVDIYGLNMNYPKDIPVVISQARHSRRWMPTACEEALRAAGASLADELGVLALLLGAAMECRSEELKHHSVYTL
jgi:hypothetical protein